MRLVRAAPGACAAGWLTRRCAPPPTSQTAATAPGGACAACGAHTGLPGGCEAQCPACAALVQAVASLCQGAQALSDAQAGALGAALQGSDCFALLSVLLAGNATCAAAFAPLLGGANHTAGASLAAAYPCLAAGGGSCPPGCQSELDVLAAACAATGAPSAASWQHACACAWR